MAKIKPKFSKQARKAQSRKRKWFIAAGLTAGLLLVAWLLLPLIVSPILHDKLQEMVSNQLKSRLEMGSVRYRFPYGVVIRDARLMGQTDTGDKEVLSIAEIDLSLAKLPIGHGPLVIEKIIIDSPIVRMIRTDHGIIGPELVRKDEEPSGKPPRKLSEIFRLRKLAINGGKVEYTDQTRPGVAPMVYEHLSADLNISRKSGALYHWDFVAGGGTLADVKAKGSADVDQLLLDVEKLTFTAELNPDAARTALPPQLQQIVNLYQMHGSATITATAHVPLNEPKNSVATTTIELKNGSASLPDGRPALQDLALKMKVDQEQTTTLSVQNFEASSSDARLKVDSATARIDPTTQSWQIMQVVGKATVDGQDKTQQEPAGTSGSVDFAGRASGSIPKDGELNKLATYANASTRPLQDFSFSAIAKGMSFHPPTFPNAIENITGVVDGDLNGLRISNLSAAYGNDTFFISTARVPLGSLPDRLDVLDFLAELRFVPPSIDYPEPLKKLIAELNPSGTFFVAGKAGVDLRMPKLKPDWDLTLNTQNAGVWLLDSRLGVSDMKADIHLVPSLIEARSIQGKVFEGSVALSGVLRPSEDGPTPYQGRIDLDGVDLGLAQKALRPESDRKFAGKLHAGADFNGELIKDQPPIDGIAAKGEAEISDGVLWEAPVLAEITSRVKIAREVLTAGQAAAVFSIADRRVELTRAAISSPALGLNGGGNIGFDGSLDLKVVAAPLGDWRGKLRSTGIPVVSNLAGELVGGIQKILNTATSELLYEFRIKGTAKEPDITAVPAPMLTDAAAKVFSRMLKATEGSADGKPAPKDEHLIDSIRNPAAAGDARSD